MSYPKAHSATTYNTRRSLHISGIRRETASKSAGRPFIKEAHVLSQNAASRQRTERVTDLRKLSLRIRVVSFSLLKPNEIC